MDDSDVIILDDGNEEEDECQVVAIVSKAGTRRKSVNRKQSPLYTRSKLHLLGGRPQSKLTVTATKGTKRFRLSDSPKFENRQSPKRLRSRSARKSSLKRLGNKKATPPMRKRPVRYFTDTSTAEGKRGQRNKRIHLQRAREQENEDRTGKFRNRPLIPPPPPAIESGERVYRNPILGSQFQKVSYHMMPPPSSLTLPSISTGPSQTQSLLGLPPRPQVPRMLVAPSSFQVVRGPNSVLVTAPLGKPRPIIIDGSNVAIGHGQSKAFSCRGLQICVNRIKECLRHSEIICFVPKFRQKKSQSIDTQILDQLEAQGIVKFTPSREVNGRDITSYDDRFILEYATATGGIVITNDNYKDLFETEPKWRDTITNRLLQFTWVNDLIMFPSDPLGKYGPNLAQFCSFPSEQ